MKQPVLTSKLHMPKMDFMIHRAMLVETLEKKSDLPLIVIQAAAGFGKTSLVYDWLTHSRHHICWFSIDLMNDVPSEFWRYICASLEVLNPDITQDAQLLLDNPHMQDVTPICDSLIATLNQYTRSRNRPDKCVLVLDDFQHIKNKKILESLGRFIDLKPYWLQVVITCRTLPEMRIPYRLSKHQAMLISNDELSYTKQECAEVIAQFSPGQFNDKQIEQIYNQSQGWPAAIQLLALSPKSISENMPPAVQNDLVSDYLLQEVFVNLKPSIQTLLSKASVLPKLNFEALQFISKGAAEKSDFDQIVLSGLVSSTQDGFVTIHPLLREWLEYNESLATPIETIHSRTLAIEWLVSKHMHEDAFSLAINNQSWSQAANLLWQIFNNPSKGGHLDYLHFLLNHFPEEILESLPKLAIYKAVLLFNQHKKNELNHYLNLAQTILSNINVKNPLNQPDAMQLEDLGIQNVSEFIEIQKTLTILQDLVWLFDGKIDKILSIDKHFSLDTNHPMNCWWHYLKFVHAFLLEDINKAILLGNQALDFARTNKDVMCTITTVSWLSHCLHQNGQVSLALEKCLDVKHWVHSINAIQVPNVFSLYAALGFLYIERLESDKAFSMYELVEKNISEFSEPREVIFNKFHLKFRLLMTTQQLDKAKQCLEDMTEFEAAFVHDEQPAFSAMPDTCILEMLYELRLNNAMPLIQWSMQYAPPESNVAMKHNLERFMQAIGLTLCGQDQTDELNTLTEWAASSGNQARLLNIQLFNCSRLYTQGETEAAQALLDQVLVNAENFGYRQLVLDGGQAVMALLQSGTPFSPQAGFRETLLAKVKQPNSGLTSAKTIEKDPIKPSPDLKEKIDLLDRLTPRETEILEQLSQGKRNQEIATSLIISVPTVKRHIQNIYSKLCIHSRTEAALLFNAVHA